MNTENLAFNDSTNTQIIKHFHAVFPSIYVAVLAHTLVIESVDLTDLPGFVVTPQQCDMAGVPDFQTHQ